MNKDIADAQAETLRTWADQWSRDGESGSGEIAFLLVRAGRLMRAEERTIESSMPLSVLESGLSNAPVQSEITGD